MEWTIVTAVLGSVGIIAGAVVKIIVSRAKPDNSWEGPLKNTQEDITRYREQMDKRFDAFKSHSYETFQNHHDRLVHLEADFSQTIEKIEEVKSVIEKLETKIQALTEMLIKRNGK